MKNGYDLVDERLQMVLHYINGMRGHLHTVLLSGFTIDTLAKLIDTLKHLEGEYDMLENTYGLVRDRVYKNLDTDVADNIFYNEYGEFCDSYNMKKIECPPTIVDKIWEEIKTERKKEQ